MKDMAILWKGLEVFRLLGSLGIWKLSAYAGVFRALGSLESWKLGSIQIIWKLRSVENLIKIGGIVKKFGNLGMVDIKTMIGLWICDGI